MASVNLKTIANYTGLSVTTVSRALKDGDDVKQVTKDKVMEAAKKLGYKPNLFGLSLRTGINYNICAVLPMVKAGDIIGDVGNLSLISGLTQGLEGTPYHLTVLPLLANQEPIDPIKYAVESNLCGGVIFASVKPQDDRITYLYEKNVPFVTFGRSEMSIEHAYVDIDNYDFSYRAANMLFDKGCKFIKMICSTLDYTYTWHKIYGIKRAAMERGMPFDIDKNIIFDTSVVGNYRTYIGKLLEEENFDGLICGSEISTLGCLAAASDVGKVVGKDLHMVCEETSDLPTFGIPQVSGFRQDLNSIGIMLSRYIIKLVEGEEPKKLTYIEKTTFHPRG